jgi:sialidase-1
MVMAGVIPLASARGRPGRSTSRSKPRFSGYSDLAVLPDGTILCFYQRGSIDGKNSFGTDRLTVARFNLEWLTDGADTTSPPAP